MMEKILVAISEDSEIMATSDSMPVLFEAVRSFLQDGGVKVTGGFEIAVRNEAVGWWNVCATGIIEDFPRPVEIWFTVEEHDFATFEDFPDGMDF
jgi:hypothetical protein